VPRSIDWPGAIWRRGAYVRETGTRLRHRARRRPARRFCRPSAPNGWIVSVRRSIHTFPLRRADVVRRGPPTQSLSARGDAHDRLCFEARRCALWLADSPSAETSISIARSPPPPMSRRPSAVVSWIPRIATRTCAPRRASRWGKTTPTLTRLDRLNTIRPMSAAPSVSSARAAPPRTVFATAQQARRRRHPAHLEKPSAPVVAAAQPRALWRAERRWRVRRRNRLASLVTACRADTAGSSATAREVRHRPFFHRPSSPRELDARCPLRELKSMCLVGGGNSGNRPRSSRRSAYESRRACRRPRSSIRRAGLEREFRSVPRGLRPLVFASRCELRPQARKSIAVVRRIQPAVVIRNARNQPSESGRSSPAVPNDAHPARAAARIGGADDNRLVAARSTLVERIDPAGAQPRPRPQRPNGSTFRSR